MLFFFSDVLSLTGRLAVAGLRRRSRHGRLGGRSRARSGGGRADPSVALAAALSLVSRRRSRGNREVFRAPIPEPAEPRAPGTQPTSCRRRTVPPGAPDGAGAAETRTADAARKRA